MRVDQSLRAISVVAAALIMPMTTDHGHTEHPRVDRVEPESAKPGAEVTAIGVNLGRSSVMDLILANPDVTALTHICEQKDTFIRFRIPRSLAPGQYSILLTSTDYPQPRLLPQGVMVTVTKPTPLRENTHNERGGTSG